MKKILLAVLPLLAVNYSYAQFSTPSPGLTLTNDKVGIGAGTPNERLTIGDPSIPYDANAGIIKLKFDSGNGGGAIGFEKETFNTGGLRFYTQYGWGSSLEKMRITGNGNVGIGTTNPDAKLAVHGTIHATEIKVDQSVPTPDYVFDKDYDLASLKDVKTYIDKNHHLPEIPSAAQVAKDGINLGEMNAKLLKKIEELTLYLIEKDEKEKKSEERIQKLEKQIELLISKTK